MLLKSSVQSKENLNCPFPSKTVNKQAVSILFPVVSNRNLCKDRQEQKCPSRSFSRAKLRFSGWKSVLEILHCCWHSRKKRFHSEICQPGTVYIGSNVTTKPAQTSLYLVNGLNTLTLLHWCRLLTWNYHTAQGDLTPAQLDATSNVRYSNVCSLTEAQCNYA